MSLADLNPASMSRAWTMSRPRPGWIEVTFDGFLSAEDGRLSAEAFVAELEAAPRETFDVVWNIRAMTGYHAMARSAWQRAVWPHRGKLRRVTVRGGNPFVRMAASALCALLGVPCAFE